MVFRTSNHPRNDQASEYLDTRNQVSRTGYDRLDRAVKSIDSLGNESTTVYDTRGQVVESRSSDGQVTRTSYDALGRSEWTTDSTVPGTPTQGTRTIYDQQGRVVRTERYDDVVLDVVTSNGRTRSVFVSAATTPTSVSESVYDQLGRVTESNATASPTSKPVYDRLGRVTRNETYDGTTLLTWNETTYDAAGRVLTSKDALGRAMRSEYDGDGRATVTHYADGTTMRVVYDSLGRKAADIDPLGRRTEYGYDTQGRLIEVRQPAVADPLNGNALTVPVTQYQYDTYGNHVQITDARGRITRWTYDEFGQQTSRTLPAVAGEPTAVETTTYNSRGQMLTHTDFKGQVTRYFYDTDAGREDPWNPGVRKGRLTAVEYYVNAGATTPTETVQYRYGRDGQREMVVDSVAGTTDYDYDGEDRLVRVQGPAGLAQTIHYGYDEVTGQQTRMWTDQTEVRYGYDLQGRMSTVTLVKREGVTLTNAEETSYAFDTAGQLTSITQKVGTSVVLTSTMTYDVMGRMLSRVNADGSSNLLSSFTYTRLADGNIATVHENVKQPDGTFVATTAAYTYDALNRLTREQVDTAGVNDDYTTDYVLDLVGNRVRKIEVKGSGVTERTESTFDARDRLLEEKFYDAVSGGTLTNTQTYGYEHNGSLTSRTATVGGSLVYVWDLRGLLRSATVTGGGVTKEALYRFDAYGIRLREDVTETAGGIPLKEIRLLVIDHLSPTGSAQTVEERTESGLIVANHIYGLSLDPISMARAGQALALYLADGHSGVRQVVGLGSSQVLASYRYNAFGTKLVSAGTVTNSLLYRGERFDEVLNHYYLRARMYDPENGRFIAEDPFRGDLINPTTFHRYIYGGLNPVGYSDPSGMMFGYAGLSLGSMLKGIGIAGVMTTLAGAAGAFMGYSSGDEGGLLQGFIPGWGSGRGFGAAIRNGKWGWAALNGGMVIVDVVGAGSTLKGLRAAYNAVLERAAGLFTAKAFIAGANGLKRWWGTAYHIDATTIGRFCHQMGETCGPSSIINALVKSGKGAMVDLWGKHWDAIVKSLDSVDDVGRLIGTSGQALMDLGKAVGMSLRSKIGTIADLRNGLAKSEGAIVMLSKPLSETGGHYVLVERFLSAAEAAAKGVPNAGGEIVSLIDSNAGARIYVSITDFVQRFQAFGSGKGAFYLY